MQVFSWLQFRAAADFVDVHATEGVVIQVARAIFFFHSFGNFSNGSQSIPTWNTVVLYRLPNRGATNGLRPRLEMLFAPDMVSYASAWFECLPAVCYMFTSSDPLASCTGKLIVLLECTHKMQFSSSDRTLTQNTKKDSI